MIDTRKDQFIRGFLEGAERFNTARFWDAHESWEELWLDAGSDMHRFLQGLIQLAAAYHHIQRGTLSGAVRLVDAAIEKLEDFPADYCGVERSTLTSTAGRHRERAARILEEGLEPRCPDPSELPRIELSTNWEARIPEDW